jgi:hypothetical protein
MFLLRRSLPAQLPLRTNHPIQQLNRILQLLRRKMGIALGHDQGLMTQQLL